MDKQQNELVKSYGRARKMANQPKFYEVKYALKNPKFDVIDFENFKQLDKIANFVARKPELIEKFKNQIHSMTTNHAKVILAYQPQLHQYFKNIIPNFMFSAITHILARQIGPKEFTDKLKYINKIGMENIINLLGSYGAFENISSKHMVDLLIKNPEIYETVKKYFKMKFLDGDPLFALINELPEFFSKEELNVNTIKEDDFYHLLKFYPELEKHPKVTNYKYKSAF